MSTATDELRKLWEQDAVKVLAVIGALYVVYVLLGIVLGYSTRGQLNSLTRLTFVIGVFAMLSLALNLHWGYTGLFNIGIVGFMAVAIYTMAIVSKPATAPSATRLPGLGMPLIVGVLAGMLAAALFGLVIALPALRLRADYLAIVTIATAEIIRFIVMSRTFQNVEIFGTTIGTGGGRGLLLNYTPPLQGLLEFVGLWGSYLGLVDAFGAVVPNNPKPIVDGIVYSIFLFIMVGVFYWILSRTGKSPFGRVLRAIKEDETVTRALGKNTGRFKIKSFMLGCALMGLAGILWQFDSGSITPAFFRPRVTFFVWIALIIGGAGSNTGSVLGGAVFAGVLFEGPRYLKSVIEETIEIGSAPNSFGQAVAPLFGRIDPVPLAVYTLDNVRAFQLVIMGVVLVWLMQNRPDGLLGHRKDVASSIGLSRPKGAQRTADATSGTTDETADDAGGDTDE